MKTKFAIYYHRQIARFSNEIDARIFGRAISARGQLVEMTDRTGLIGQWRDGKEMPEFAGRD